MTPDIQPRTNRVAPTALGWIYCVTALVAGVGTALSGRVEGAMCLALGVAAGALEVWRRRSAAGTRSSALGSYTLDEKVGQGGMGVVYKASHALLQRPAAIKLLVPERAGERAVERFEREVQVTSRLTHPNTISIYDFGRTPDGTFYYAMEYVDGLDLQTLVEHHGPQPPARVAHLLSQLAGALAEAHDAGLIHRDVKPANVMVCERGGMLDVVKVLDFGLVKQMDSDEDAASTDAHRIVGTPLYLAPEALTAPESLDARSDLYALGALAYFLLTGSAPFSGTNVVDVCRQHLYSDPTPVSLRAPNPVPHALETLVMSCLAKSREARPPSASHVRAALLPLASTWGQRDASAWWADSPANESEPAASVRASLNVQPFAPTLELAA